MAVLLLNGHVFVALESNGQVRMTKASRGEEVVSDGLTHTISISREADEWCVKLDDVTHRMHAPRRHNSLGLGAGIVFKASP